MAMALPVRIRGDGVRVAVETDPAHAPLRDFLLNDLGEDVAAILRAKGRLSAGPAGPGGPHPWQELYRFHRLDYDGAVVHLRDVGGWSSCDLDPGVLLRCLEEYLEQVGAVRHRQMLEGVLQSGTERFVPDRELPVAFRVDGPGEVACLPAPGNEPLAGLLGDAEFVLGLDWMLAELGRPGAAVTWPGRVFRVGVADGLATIEGEGGAYLCLDGETFRQVVAVFRQAHADSHRAHRAAAPGRDEPVAAVLALGGTSRRTRGWALVRTPRATLEDVAGLTPHPDACLPHGVLGTGSGACWADLAVLDEAGGRLRGGTKTFMPRGIDADRLVPDLRDALTRARFLASVPGAWASFVAGVPVHGYVDPDAVVRLPCAPVEAEGVAQHVRVFFPELVESGVDLEGAASRAAGTARAVSGAPHVLTAFLLHDVQCHRHHLDVVRAARPGWEHTGNACHLRLDVRTVRLEHLWLDGHACELPTGEFARVLEEYERLAAL
ncbi:hypothetical protein ACQPZ8_03840 [Actinomadura nitritigenes]|jgi:hypothetical protein|uniref:hypothetical protein n=1 Tax=Actinomadura TaxID=1988 RepID=UPI0016895918|nr:hypothetical protein [Actinomadura sp. RB99]MBD2893396.1 hypothetical protein [Actinomadura sp. RB99]